MKRKCCSGAVPTFAHAMHKLLTELCTGVLDFFHMTCRMNFLLASSPRRRGSSTHDGGCLDPRLRGDDEPSGIVLSGRPHPKHQYMRQPMAQRRQQVER